MASQSINKNYSGRSALVLMLSASALAFTSVGVAYAGGPLEEPLVVEEEKKPEGRIRAGRKNVDLRVYGHVNQAFLFANGAGDASRVDLVDNDNSGSRFGFRGQYNFGDWFSGVRLEFNAERNTTDELNFTSEDSLGTLAGGGDGEDDFFSVRWVHWNIGNKKFGNLNFGFTEEASQGIAERDLSGTTLIAESDVDDIGGEFQFGNSTFDTLGGAFEVDDFFSNLDGARDAAITYDLPKFKVGPGELQFRVSGRVEEEDAAGDPTDPVLAGTFEDAVQFLPSASVSYKGEVSGYKFDTAAAWRREADITVGDFAVNSNVFIGSLSVLAPFGTSLTFGGGVQTFSEDDDGGSSSAPIGQVDPGNENFFYVKAGQQFNFFDFGKTAFSVDAFFGQQIEDFGSIQADVDGLSIGGGVVQTVKPLGAEIYAAARFYDVEFDNFRNIDGTSAALAAAADPTTAEDPESLFFFFTGARIRF